ncbi:unnamed protein product [Didymodactylos carnosus]|uniref:ADP ribosyltransferase domain-containing protein n=1 Tax=Didymodactylos carnosus TaxID=1234261 RepID=A0A814LIU8_9BILA|nr:unnamed protein product [Didymodactylos carnosus]CAF3833335.1 unnamed protein product [Didymodactylos carnosus]
MFGSVNLFSTNHLFAVGFISDATCLKNKQLYQDLLDDNKYSKLMGIYVEYNDLFEALQNELCLLLQHLSIFNLFEKNSKPICDLNDESLDYLRYQLLRDTLMNMNLLASKQEMIDYYPKRLFEENLEFYREVSKSFVVYRDGELFPAAIAQLKILKGKYISTNGFLSTILLRDVAECFMFNVIFEIIIDTELTNSVYAYISEFNENPHEEEILFDLGAVFKITDIRNIIKREKDILIVSMTCVGDAECLKNDYIEKQRNIMQQDFWPDNYYGDFLIKMDIHLTIANIYLAQENYLYALKHLDQCLEIHNEFDPSNYDEKVNIHFSIGKTYHRMVNYPKALKHLLECVSIRHRPISFSSYPIFTTIYRLIGTIYFKTKELNLSLQYYTEALEYEQQTRSETTEMCGTIHNDLGECYYLQDQYAEAGEHYQKSLTIIERTNNKNGKREMTRLNYCIRYCYLLQNNDEDDLILKHFIKSFELFENYSSEYDDFVTIIKISKYITALYMKKDNDNLLLTHFERMLLLMQKQNLNEKEKIEVQDLCIDIGSC